MKMGQKFTFVHRKKLSQARIGKFGREKSPSWKGGLSFEPYTIDWTDTLRKSIRERDHYLCQVCNGSGNHVHHIDYDKKNCNPPNLITLCRTCHMKTNFNRSKWLEYFQQNGKL